MRARPIFLSCLILGSLNAAGCTRYTPRPVEPMAIAVKRSNATLDPVAVAARCREIAPLAQCDVEAWDQAMILSAVLLYNPEVAAAKAGIVSAEANARAARTPAGPVLTLTSEYAGAAPDPSPWLFGAGLAVPLDTGGVRRTRLASADLAILGARYGWTDAIWSARTAAAQAITEVQAGEAQRGLSEALIAVQERRLAALQRRMAAGLVARVEVDRARIDLADATRRLREAHARIDAGHAALAAAIGVPMTAKWSISFTPDALPDVGLGMRQSAAVGRSDVLRAVAAYDQAEIDLRGEISKQFPQLNVGPGFTWERGLVKIPFNPGLTLPPLDLNRRAIAAAEVRRSEAGTKLEAAVAAAGVAIDVALADAEAARDAFRQISVTDVPLAEKLAAQADRELRAGLIDRTDWAVAQAGVLTAKLSEIDAIARLKRDDITLEFALRRPLRGPETTMTRVTP